MGMETRFHRLCVCFQVILAHESIVLCMCSGNVLIGYKQLSTKFEYPSEDHTNTI